MFIWDLEINKIPLKTKLSLRLVSILLLVFAHIVCGQDKSNQTNTARKPTGVSVAPAHFHFNQKPGEIRTYDVTVNNNTSIPKQFNVNMYDFNMNGKGKSSFFFKESVLGRFFHRVAMSVCVSVCVSLFMY